MIGCALFCAVPLSASADAVIYRCVGTHGLVYQDTPCAGAKDSQNRVLVTGTVAQPPSTQSPRNNASRDRALSEWIARTSQENRVREAETHLRAVQKRKQADEAEFAAMIGEIDQKKQDSAAGVAEAPPMYELDTTEAQLQQNYVEKAQQNQLELNLARDALAAEQQR